MFYDDGFSDPEYAPTGAGTMIIMGYLLAVFICIQVAKLTGWGSEEKIKNAAIYGAGFAVMFGMVAMIACYVLISGLELLPDSFYRAMQFAAFAGWGWGAGQVWHR